MKKILILFLIYTLELYASDHDYYFTSLSIGQGLSHSTATSILSDSRGMLWIGTAFGLNCYNGYEMKNYYHDKEDSLSLPNSFIHFVTEDDRSTVWVSTMNGLVKYDRSEDGFTSPLPGQSVKVYSFYNAPDGIYFGGDSLLYQYNYKEKFFRTIPSEKLSTSGIMCISQWKDGNLLLIFSNGETRIYHPAGKQMSETAFRTLPVHITAAYMDKNYNLYVSSYQRGLFVFGADGKEKYQLNTRNSELTCDVILDMVEKDGQLWMATDGGGINMLDLNNPFSVSSFRNIPGNANSIPSNSIGSLYKDRLDNIWAGSIREGVFEIKKTFIQTYGSVFRGNNYGLSNKTVSSMCSDLQGMIWLGTDGEGINRFDPKTQIFTHYPATYNEKVVSIVDYSSSELLVLFFLKGAFLFNKVTGKYTPYHCPEPDRAQPNYLYKLSDRRILFLSSEPYIYDKESRKSVILKTKEDPALFSNSRLISTGSNAVYLLKDNNLMKIDLATDSLYSFFKVRNDELVQVACEDKKGIFWIGTDRGIRRYDPSCRKYEEIATSLFNRVTGIIPGNDNRLWLGAQNMLFSYNTEDGQFMIWGESDGFIPNEISEVYLFQPNSPYLYLGGTHGLVRINNSGLSVIPAEPDIQLADIILDGISVSGIGQGPEKHAATLSVPSNYKSLLLHVVALDKDIFCKTLFRYAVQGSENLITETYSSVIPLNMLSPGTYTIQVSCYMKNGVWSAPRQVLSLFIPTPWYKDYRILTAIFVGFVCSLFWWYLIFMRRKEEKMKIRFLISISDELRTHLMLIYAPLRRMIEKINEEPIDAEKQEVLKKQLSDLLRSSDRMRMIVDLILGGRPVDKKESPLQIRPKTLHAVIKQQYYETYLNIAENVPKQISNDEEEFLAKFNKLVLDNLASKEMDIKFLTEHLGMSRTPLYAKIKKLTDLGVNDYINRLRIERAAELLTHSTLSIAEISDSVGFEYQKYFSTLFKRIKGISPSQFRQQKQGADPA